MLDALGNIGDFLGGIAVVVTLLYLAHQVRQNTKSTHSASYQAIVSSMSVFSRDLAFSEDASALFMKGLHRPEQLTTEEQVRFSLLMTSYFRSFENIHFQYDSNAIPDDVWAGWAHRIASSVNSPGCRAWWEREQRAYSGPFRRYINEEALHTRVGPITLGTDLAGEQGGEPGPDS